MKNLNGVFTFPFAEMRKDRGLRDHDFGAPEAVPDLDESSDTEDRPQGEETINADAENADEPTAKAEARLLYTSDAADEEDRGNAAGDASTEHKQTLDTADE